MDFDSAIRRFDSCRPSQVSRGISRLFWSGNPGNAGTDGDRCRTGTGTAELPCLTGIRGWAAVAVVLFHLNLPGFQYAWLAVDVFFVLSGFVLAHVYRDGLSRGNFLWARFARIAPVHLVATGAYCLLAASLGVVTWWGAIEGVLLISLVSGPTWSLRIEIIDYLLFALLMPRQLAQRIPPRFLILAGAAVAAVPLAVIFLAAPAEPAFWRQFCRGVGWFTVGVGLYQTGWRPRRTWLFDNKLSRWLGDISYPLYLVHGFALAAFAWLPVGAVVIIAFGLATVLHRMIELPARRWLRQIAGNKKAGPGLLPAGHA